MIFNKTSISGAYLIKLEKKEDERGFLAQTWDKDEFAKNNIPVEIVQGYITLSSKKGTMRGLHYQVEPYAEVRLTKCIKGSFYEIIIDLRPTSPTYLSWEGFTFRADDFKMLYVPANCAHGILTLEDNTQLMNFSDKPYTAGSERGIRYNDPKFDMDWPIEVKHVSKKDLSWEDFK